ncbi:MAG TPA: hypothetical protein VF502_16815 [Stellaceae bacterium]
MADAEDPALDERKEAKERAAAALKEVIATIEEEGREPDEWERVALLQGVNAIFWGGYEIAELDARIAAAPKNRRSSAGGRDHHELLDTANVALLKRALDAAVEEPVRRYPQFGPIILTGRPGT